MFRNPSDVPEEYVDYSNNGSKPSGYRGYYFNDDNASSRHNVENQSRGYGNLDMGGFNQHESSRSHTFDNKRSKQRTTIYDEDHYALARSYS